MSNDTPTVHVITDAPANAEETAVEPKKPNFFQAKVVAPIKKHPKIALAAGLGLALVAGAALTGKHEVNSDSTNAPFELEPASYDDETVYLSTDTEIA
jgi:hypothetical protein